MKLNDYLRLGFDRTKHVPFTRQYRVACSQCEALVVNSTPTHEVGCPNQNRNFVPARKPRKYDFSVSGGGTLYMLYPLSKAAKQWADDNLPSDRQTLGTGIAVEHRYIGDIVQGIRNDGLTVE